MAEKHTHAHQICRSQLGDNDYITPPPLPPRPSHRPLSIASLSPVSPPPVPTSPRPRYPALHSTSDQPQKPVSKTQGNIHSRLHSTQSESTHTDSGSEDDERLTLSELITKYSKSFPLRVQVMKGFFGDRGDENEIASGEEYNIHFVKHTKVVKIKDNYGHNTFIVPFNSAARFGIIYRGDTASREPQKFETVGEVMAAVPQPKVICAKCSYYGTDAKSSVSKDEVLVVQGIHRGKLGFGRSVLKVKSVLKREEKLLQKDCIGQFTTDPYYTQMYLPELLSSVSQLPLTAKMYLDVEGDTFPEYLISEPVILAEQFTDRSLVATFVDTEAVPGDVPNVLVDLPTRLDIEVAVIHDKATEKEKLYEDTRDLYNRFEPCMLKTCVDASSDDTYATQSQFLATIRDGHETEGLHLEMPQYQPLKKSMMNQDLDYETVRFGHTPSPPPTPSSDIGPGIPPKVERRVSGGSQDGAYDIPLRSKEQLPMSTDRSQIRAEILPPKPQQRKESGDRLQKIAETRLPIGPKPKETVDGTQSRVEAPISPQQDGSTDISLSSQLDTLRASIQNLHTRMEILESAQKFHSAQELSSVAELSQIKNDCGNLVPIAQKLTQSCRLLEARIEKIEMQPDTKPPALPPRTSATLNSELATLSQMQILKLLDVLDMRKYQKKFAQASINGAILLECDESTLQHELEVTSKLDRIKLMKLISGQYSALRILEGDDAYVKFECH